MYVNQPQRTPTTFIPLTISICQFTFNHFSVSKQLPLPPEEPQAYKNSHRLVKGQKLKILVQLRVFSTARQYF